jgi:hypothetical protein
VPLRIAVVVLFLLASWALYLRRRDLMGVGAVSEAPVGPRAAVIIPISIVSEDVVPVDGAIRVMRKRPDGDLIVSLPGEDIDADIAALDVLNRWSSQQVLRAVAPHRQSLRYVYLLGSTGGSAEQTKAAKAMILPYLRPDTEVFCAATDCDSVTAVMKCISEAINQLSALPGADGQPLPEHQIIIDVTGGLKPTSIAGAAMTLSRNVTFQYVHTRTGQVREFDLLQKSASF